MGKIVAWKCDDTGKIFEHNNDYKNHRRRLNYARRRVQRIKDKKEEAFNKIKGLYELESLDEIVDFINKNFIDLYDYVFFDEYKKSYPSSFEMEIRSIYYTNNLSNSHSCPKNGVTNWCGTVKNAPKGYPGISGRVFVKSKYPSNTNIINRIPSFWVSSFLGKLGLNTGTGGGGGGEHSYELSIFIDDFPGLGRKITYAKVAGIEPIDIL